MNTTTNYPITGLIKDWSFRIDEKTPSHYFMEGRRRSGETLSAEGDDPILLAEKIAAEALKIDEKYFNPQKEFFKEYYFNTDLPEVFPQVLNRIILEEILLGNWIQDYWKNYGQGVLLANPFRISRQDVGPPLEYLDINDPHYWKDEVHMKDTEYFVAAAFGK
jgi:hypothetical protein